MDLRDHYFTSEGAANCTAPSGSLELFLFYQIAFFTLKWFDFYLLNLLKVITLMGSINFRNYGRFK